MTTTGTLPGLADGDNAVVGIDGCGPNFFPAAVDFSNRWNGWLAPAFRRPAAEAVVEWINRENAGDADQDRLEWDGDEIVHHSPLYAEEPNYQPWRYVADEDGRYWIGAFNWTWTTPHPEGFTVPASLGDEGERPWYVGALAAWASAAEAAGIVLDETTHDHHVVAFADEATTAGAVRCGRHWYLIRQCGGGVEAVQAVFVRTDR